MPIPRAWTHGEVFSPIVETDYELKAINICRVGNSLDIQFTYILHNGL